MRFRILRVAAEGPLPASPDARRHGCLCPVSENRAGAGWDVSDDSALKGFWIFEQCAIHGQPDASG